MALSAEDRAEVLGLVQSQLLSSPQGFLTAQFMPYLGAGRNASGRVPLASVRRTATQSIGSSATPTAITFDTLVADTGGLWSAAAPTKLTIRDPGFYVAVAYASWAADATSYRVVQIFAGGSPQADDVRDPVTVGGSGTSATVVTPPLECVAGSEFLLRVAQETGGALTVTARLGVVKVGNV